ncbi:ribonuclease R [Bacillus safensis FO-36b] [Bacillus safensis subsp. safensis]
MKQAKYDPESVGQFWIINGILYTLHITDPPLPGFNRNRLIRTYLIQKKTDGKRP